MPCGNWSGERVARRALGHIMRTGAILFILLATLALAACDTVGRLGAGEPTKTSLPEHLPPDSPANQKVAVCYTGRSTTKQALYAAAAELCKEPGSSVQYLMEDLNLNDCPLLKKRRAVFVCYEPR